MRWNGGWTEKNGGWATQMVVELVETTLLNHYDKLVDKPKHADPSTGCETNKTSQWAINPEGFREQLASPF